MKFKVTFKDPDSLLDAIDDAVDESIPSEITNDEEREALGEVRKEKYRDLCKRWFEHSEYLRVEIDTEAKTCTVLEVES